ncbi:flagellar protein FliT [Thalassobacillus hwangdonensis]|uniref:Flagellar protein FliT n=1 Tax=Thalassobacillus hwangdonensis TaxID=546108 RepID=A0ABW3L2L6_9BACI
MSEVTAYYKLTMELKELLQQKVTNSNREEVLQEANRILDQRELKMQKLPEALETEEEKQQIKAVLKLDPALQKRFQIIFTDLKTEMRNTKKQRNSNQKYTNPYQNVSNYDGMFLDKKK